MAFMRSGRLSVTTLTCGRGFSTRTYAIASPSPEAPAESTGARDPAVRARRPRVRWALARRCARARHRGCMAPPPGPAARAFQPATLGPLRLRNRLIKSATYEGMTPGGAPSDALLRFHRTLAAGGVAMTTVAYGAVSPDGRTFGD